jgi:hypothetical protein
LTRIFRSNLQNLNYTIDVSTVVDGGPAKKLRIPEPFSSWQFWAMIACAFPTAVFATMLVWLYMLSYLITPNGLIAYVAAAIHMLAFFWGIFSIYKFQKQAKARRVAGVPRRPISFRLFPVVFAMMLVTAPIVPIAVRLAVPDISDKNWIELSTYVRKKELGF